MQSRLKGKIPVLAFTLCCSVAMVYLALPRSIAAIYLFNGTSVLKQLRQGRPVRDARLPGLLRSLTSARRWTQNGELAIDAALVQIGLNAGRTSLTAANKAHFAIAHKNLIVGLSRSPMDGNAWRWLSILRLAQTGDKRKAIAALRQSYYTAPYVTYLASQRLPLALILWNQFTKDEHTMLYRQIRFVWSLSEYDVVVAAARSRNAIPVMVALSERPADLLKFERQLKQFRSQSR